jgi:hypothetical protein
MEGPRRRRLEDELAMPWELNAKSGGVLAVKSNVYSKCKRPKQLGQRRILMTPMICVIAFLPRLMSS